MFFLTFSSINLYIYSSLPHITYIFLKFFLFYFLQYSNHSYHQIPFSLSITYLPHNHFHSTYKFQSQFIYPIPLNFPISYLYSFLNTLLISSHFHSFSIYFLHLFLHYSYYTSNNPLYYYTNITNSTNLY